MVDPDHVFYRRRAFQERVAAVACEDKRAALAHLKLADLYDDRLQQVSRVDDRAIMKQAMIPPATRF